MNRHELVRDGLILAALTWMILLARTIAAADVTLIEGVGAAALTIGGAVAAYRKGHDYRQQPVGENG